MVKLPKYSSKQFSRLPVILFSIILGFYALNWIAYGLEYSKARSAILKHYGSVAQAYTCGGAAVPKASTFKLRPKSYLIPADGVSYAISATNDGIAEGYVVPFGGVVETSQPQACMLQ
jgi:hypothetical protein